MPDTTETTRYARSATGSVMEITENHPGSAGTPDDGQDLSTEEGQAAMREAERRIAEHAAEVHEADSARHQAAYGALVEVGLPEAVARDLASYERDPGPAAGNG
ncbi:hypothetical protein AB4Z54_22725 [Streptomyces sp. MCAF7]